MFGPEVHMLSPRYQPDFGGAFEDVEPFYRCTPYIGEALLEILKDPRGRALRRDPRMPDPEFAAAKAYSLDPKLRTAFATKDAYLTYVQAVADALHDEGATP